ncbi:MAG: hypothetical protein ACOY35_10915 [Bacillota bacterium]
MSESTEKMVSQLITMVGKVLEGQAEMKAEMDELKVDMAELKADMDEMKFDMDEMKADMNEMKADMAEAKVERVQIINSLEDINNKLSYLVADVELLEHDNLQNKKEINRIKKLMEI